MISRALLYYFMILVVIALFTVQSKSVNSAIPFLLTPPEQQQPPLEPSSSSAQTIITRTFNLNIEGLTFPIRYAITGNGNIPHKIFWEEHKSNILSISISSKSNGKLIIELPRALIDSPRVFVDGIHVPTLQTTINSKVRTLVINFHKDSSRIEIQNAASAKLVPSFQLHPPTNYQVSIVQGASSIASKAFSQNPINISTGDMVTWTNHDSTPHTVTSGLGPSDPNIGKEFDSSAGFKALLAPGQTFSHRFTTTGEFPYFCQLHPTMVGKVIVASESNIPSKQGTSTPAITSLNNRNSVVPTSPTPSVQPSTSLPSISPSINNRNPTNARIDYSSLCTRLQPVLVQSCHTLVNNNNSLTSQGNHALRCVKSAILLGGNASSWVGVPLSVVLNGLSMLAPPAGCDVIINMSGFSQLANIGSLGSLIKILP